MRSKGTILTILAGANVLLAMCLLLQATSLPTARAQTRTAGRAGDFLCVTAKAASQSYDVLYMFDLPTKKLHAFYPPVTKPRTIAHAPARDLKADFDRK